MDQPGPSLTKHGRRLPPVETRWKPGQSGNPKGRPKQEESVVGLLRDLVNALCPTDPEQRSYAELLVRSLLQKGLRGDLGAIKEILNRMAGRVPYPIERVGAVPNPPNQEASRDENSAAPGTRLKVSVEEKNEILESLGIEPIGNQANDKRRSA